MPINTSPYECVLNYALSGIIFFIAGCLLKPDVIFLAG